MLTIGGAAGVKLLKALDATMTDAAEQLVLAKATGNYKRGNERSAHLVLAPKWG